MPRRLRGAQSAKNATQQRRAASLEAGPKFPEMIISICLCALVAFWLPDGGLLAQHTGQKEAEMGPRDNKSEARSGGSGPALWA